MSDKTLDGVVLFDGASFDTDGVTVTTTYDMPYAPDDYFEYVKKVRKLIRGNATTAAEAFGRTETALDIGHTYGQNIVIGWNDAPTLQLSPVYVQLAGIEGAFLADSMSYAWGPEGMVVSSDLLLLGVSGWYGASAPATSWLRLPVPPTGLQQVAAGTVGTGVKANSVPLPLDFNYRDPGWLANAMPTGGADSFALSRNGQPLIGPTLTLEQVALVTGPGLRVREFEYGLTLEEETAAIASGPSIGLVEFIAVSPPVAMVSVAGLAPVVVSGASVTVSPSSVTLAALAPVVVGDVSVAMPAAAVSVAGVAPDLVGRQRTQVAVPAGEVITAGFSPFVSTPGSILIPNVALSVAALPPSVAALNVDLNFANVTLLLPLDGEQGGTSFEDSSELARTIISSGSVQIVTTPRKFNQAAWFNGGYLEASAADSAIGASDFTAEAWVRPSVVSSYRTIISLRTDDTYEYNVYISSGVFTIWIDDDEQCASAAISTATWYHVAVTRSSGLVRLFVNGIKSGNDYVDSASIPNTTMRIGANGKTTPGEIFSGYMDDVRITAGVARYTTNFTPPTAPFPDA